MEEGDKCFHLITCGGILEYPLVENCSCHMGNPPCSACTDVELTCNECGWTEEDFEAEEKKVKKNIIDFDLNEF